MFGKHSASAFFHSFGWKKNQKQEDAKPSFEKLTFYTSVLHKSLPNTIILFFFSKALLQKSLPNTLLLYFTTAYSHSTAESVFFQSTAIPNQPLLLSSAEFKKGPLCIYKSDN